MVKAQQWQRHRTECDSWWLWAEVIRNHFSWLDNCMGRNFGIRAWLTSNQQQGRWSFLSNNKRHRLVRSFSDFPHFLFQRKHFLPMTNTTLAKLAAFEGNQARIPGWLVESGGFTTVSRLNTERQMRLGPQPLTCRHRVFRWWAILLSRHLSACCRNLQWEIACCWRTGHSLITV